MAGPQVTATKVAGVHRSARSTVCVQLPQPAPTTSNKVVSQHKRACTTTRNAEGGEFYNNFHLPAESGQ